MKEGTYIDVNGQPKALGGDLTKLRYAKGLSQGAKKILDNLDARSSNIAGTHDSQEDAISNTCESRTLWNFRLRNLLTVRTGHCVDDEAGPNKEMRSRYDTGRKSRMARTAQA
eukprot:2137157-Amphidinium_carterae.1